MGNEQRVIEVAPEDDFLDPFLCTPEHMVDVNVVGVAGIAVKRDGLSTSTRIKHLLVDPVEMKLVVFI